MSAVDHDALIEVRGLSVAFPASGSPSPVVRGLSLSVAPGEIVALVGESGSGKSVTARSLVGLAGRGAQVTAEALRIAGEDYRGASERDWRRVRGRNIGVVLQDALVSLDPLRTVGREIAEPLLTHRIVPRRDSPDRIRELLEHVGVPEPELRARQLPGELSGGLRQRALIASAIAAEPRLLIADEPTTALDVTIQAQILGLLARIAAEGRGVLIITHDLAVVAQLAHRVLVLQEGIVVEQGTTADVLRRPSHPYTKGLIAAVPSAATRGHRLTLGTDGKEPSDARRRGTDARDERDRPSATSASAPVLQVREVSVDFPGPDGTTRRAVAAASLELFPGETVGIVGESGSGKTTLGRVALGLQRPTAGTVLLDGEEWSGLTAARQRPRRGRIQVISQDPLSSFDPQFTVQRLLAQPLRLHSALDRSAWRVESIRLLAAVGLDERFLARRPRTLSGGQRQRVAIAQALASNPDVIVCDEPVSALDVSTQAQVLDLLVELQRTRRLALLFISHDLGVVQHLSHRIVVMKDGEIVEEGTVERVFEAPEHPYTRGLLAAVPKLESRAGVTLPG